MVLIGEMRDLETIESALRIAETGHLTFATLHTNSAAQTINRIIDVFPAHQQAQIRAQLSLVLEGIICQALLPKTGGKGRAMAMEILIPNSAIRNLIREDKVHQIYGMMQAGQAKHGMQTFNQSLAALYFKRLITLEVALARSSYPDELQEIINRGPASLNPALTRVGGGVGRCPASCGRVRPAPARSRKGSSWPTRATPRRRCCGASRSRSPASREGAGGQADPPSRAASAPSASPSSPASSR